MKPNVKARLHLVLALLTAFSAGAGLAALYVSAHKPCECKVAIQCEFEDGIFKSS